MSQDEDCMCADDAKIININYYWQECWKTNIIKTVIRTVEIIKKL